MLVFPCVESLGVHSWSGCCQWVEEEMTPLRWWSQWSCVQADEALQKVPPMRLEMLEMLEMLKMLEALVVLGWTRPGMGEQNSSDPAQAGLGC